MNHAKCKNTIGTYHKFRCSKSPGHAGKCRFDHKVGSNFHTAYTKSMEKNIREAMFKASQ